MGKKYSEKVKVSVSPRQGNGEVPSDEEMAEALGRADWTDDPGVGKAVLLPDGSELLNPVQHALPLGYNNEPSIMDIVDQRIRAHRALLEDRMVVDDEKEANDFDLQEEDDIFSYYEIGVMLEDAPGLEPDKPAAKPPEIFSGKEPIPNKDDNSSTGGTKDGPANTGTQNEEGGR